MRALAGELRGGRGARRWPSASCTPTATRCTSAGSADLLGEALPGCAWSPLVRGRRRRSGSTSAPPPRCANVYVQPLGAALPRRIRGAAAAGSASTAAATSCSPRAGSATVETARRFPIRLVESGPAAGALAAARTRRAGAAAGPALLRHGRHHRQGLPDRRRRAAARRRVRGRPRVYRFKKGCGLPDPGAGDRADRDRGGRRLDRPGRPLRPAQGRAGQRGRAPRPGLLRRGRRREPTVTDADLLLGYLDPRLLPRRPDAPRSGRGRAGDRGADRPPPGARPGRAPPGASTRWSTRTWRAAARVHGDRARQGPARATRSSPSAAPGRCTPTGVAASSGCPERALPVRRGRDVRRGLPAPRRWRSTSSAATPRPCSTRVDWGRQRGAYEEMEARGGASCTAPASRPTSVRLRRTRRDALRGAGPRGHACRSRTGARGRASAPRSCGRPSRGLPRGSTATGPGRAPRGRSPGACVGLRAPAGRSSGSPEAQPPAASRDAPGRASRAAPGLLPGDARGSATCRSTTATALAPGAALRGPGDRRGARVDRRRRPRAPIRVDARLERCSLDEPPDRLSRAEGARRWIDPITLDIFWNRLIGGGQRAGRRPHAHARSPPSCARRATSRPASSTGGAT